MQAMTTKGARRAPARVVSFFPLWCKGSKRRREHQAKAPILVQRDQDQSNNREEVIVEPKPASPLEPLAGEDQLIQDKCTRCSPSKWPIVGALPSQYLGRGPGPLPINRTSHPQGRRDRIAIENRERERRVTELLLAVRRPSQEQTLARLFFLVFVHHQPKRKSTTPHTGVGYYTTTVARTSINPVSLVLFSIA